MCHIAKLTNSDYIGVGHIFQKGSILPTWKVQISLFDYCPNNLLSIFIDSGSKYENGNADNVTDNVTDRHNLGGIIIKKTFVRHQLSKKDP